MADLYDFKSLHIKHFHGFQPDKVIEQIEEWFSDPDREDYLYLAHDTNYSKPFDGNTCSDPNKDIWVEVTILYLK